MFRYVVALYCFMFAAAPLTARPADEVTDALAHAEALYFEARFNESIQLLQRIDGVLDEQPDRLPEKRAAKLQLALAYIGINDQATAKVYLRELFALDETFQMDPQLYSPKVLTLARDAKAAEDEIRCVRIQADAQSLLETENTTALMGLIAAKSSSCSGLEALQPHIAEILYAQALNLYKRGDHTTSLQKLRDVVRLSPTHELAGQYIELIQSRLQVSAERTFVEWQKRFQSRDFTLAATHFHELSSEPVLIAEARNQYRLEVAKLAASWQDACSRGDRSRADALRADALQMLPDPAIAPDLLAQMTTCVSSGCIEMNSQLALARLKTRVNPVFRTEVRTQFAVSVHARIDERGDVSVLGMEGGSESFNDAIRTAVERWKFSPIADEKGPRCVDTAIPINVRPSRLQ